MNNYQEKSSIFGLEEKTVAIILWIISILTASSNGGFSIIAISLAVLLFEKKSNYVRNHASQLLALSLVVFVMNIIVSAVLGVSFSLFYWSSITAIFASATSSIILFAYSLFKFALNLLGLVRAAKYEKCTLPIIGYWGQALESMIKPI
ncbi:MAG: hypothetical protein RR565_02565 [Erysipelothrix sp.]